MDGLAAALHGSGCTNNFPRLEMALESRAFHSTVSHAFKHRLFKYFSRYSDERDRAAIPWTEIPFIEFCCLARASDFPTLRKKEHENDDVTRPLEKLYEVVWFVTRRRDC